MTDERDVGTIERGKLAAMLPERLTLRMGKNGKIYIVSPWCAWYMHNQGGQRALKENGTFHQAPEPEKASEKPVEARGPFPNPPPAPPAPPPENTSEHQPPARKKGLFDFFGDFE
ncbi:MAG: hypothetical protein LC725_08060 [Lentisphaerae bacterium]|nr:hypothetical protein [Lentisphaerota bacterium]